ncbi:MAG: transglycosylase domain-containing protein, partial [Bacteroidota bacterium]
MISLKKISLLCALLAFAVIGSIFVPLPKEDFSKESVQSLRVVDRNGIVLREFLNDREGRGIWKPLSGISPYVRTATIAVEDKRFYSHLGVDPISVARSVVDNLQAMRFKSGGSTITQQLIRNVYHHPRTLFYKLVEMWYALRLERMMTKEEIIEQYLNRVPYGNQVYGIESASRWYFEKPAQLLSPAEAAFLAALPNSPSLLNPNKNPDAASARARTVLSRMIVQNYITQAEHERAIVQPIQIIPPDAHFKAPHAVEMVLSSTPLPENRTISTTIDYSMQEQVQRLMNAHLKKLKNKQVNNAAAIVIDNATMEIHALVGSADFFDERHNGQVNGVTALRQPGSAIKPFTYALAFDHGITPATIIPDIPT